jgi:chitinase
VSAFSQPLTVKTLDGTPPTPPSKLSLTNITGTGLTISWVASTDNVAVDSYEVFRNGKYLATTKSITYRVTGLNENTVQSFTIRAVDVGKNQSAQSIKLTTKPTIKVVGNKVYANFKLLNLGAGLAPVNVSGQMLVPHKAVLESMGLAVKYDSKNKTLSASKKGFSLRLSQGKKTAVVNGKNKTMPLVPRMMKGSLMIPLSFVAKEAGYQVSVSK